MSKKTLNAGQVLAIKNAFSAEGQPAADAIIAAIEALGADENEHGLEDIEAKVNEALEGLKNVPAPVAEMINNAIELKFRAVANVANKKGLSREVKNEIAKAIMECRGKEELKDSVKSVLVKNGVSGLSYPDIIDYRIADKFGDENPLFAQFTKVKISKFYYTAATMATASAIAKQWAKTAQGEKAIEALEATGKTISTQYVYKRQQVALEDLDDIARAGEESNFVNWITEELARVLVNTIIMAVLIGDTVNQSGQRLSTFECIGTKSTSDAFTYVTTAAATVPTVAEVRAASDEVYNPNGAKKVAIMSAAQRTAMANYKYATGGDDYYRSDAELAGQLGVDELYITDLMAGKGVIVLIPSEYYVLEKASVEVAYPTWEKNVKNWQLERNIGGGLHGLRSSAFVKPHA